jgi:p-cumate 2,3-dioxygenase ferredoxin subunit
MAADISVPIEICRSEDVPEGQVRQFTVDGIEAAIAIARVNGQFYAFEDCCTHGQASLAEEGELAGYTIECGWHAGQFDIRTGAAIASPCAIDLQIYETSLVDGRLFVRALDPDAGSL